MDKKKLNLNILVCCDLPLKVEETLMEFEVNLIKEEEYGDQNLNFAIIDDVESLEFLNSKYEFIQNHIRVISLFPVDNFNDFMSYNGRAVVHESWFDSSLGMIFIHKILSESGSVHLNQNFKSLISQVGTAKIGSHMKMGYYSDMIALAAFEHNFNVVTMRGFLDHITYYFTYLKQAGISTYPLHLEYSQVDNLFFIQMSASVRDFVGEYINASVGEEDPFDPYKHLIRSAAFLTDYLDVTYVEQNEKLVFTGVWEEMHEKTPKGRVQSFAFNNIFSAKQQDLVIEDKIKNLKAQAVDEKVRVDKTMEKLEDKRLPGGPDDIEDNGPEFIEVEGHGQLDISDMLEHIVGGAETDNPYIQLEGMTEDTLKAYLNGFGDDPDFAEKISGADISNLLEKVKDFNVKKQANQSLDKVREKIKDEKEYKTFVRKALEDNIQKISGEEISEDEVVQIVSSTIEESTDDEMRIIRGTPEEKEKAKQVLVSKLSEKLGETKANEVGVDALQKLWGHENKYVAKRSQESLGEEKKDNSMAVKSLGQEGLLQKIKQRDDLIDNMKGKLKTLMTQLKAAKEQAANAPMQVKQLGSEGAPKEDMEVQRLSAPDSIGDDEFTPMETTATGEAQQGESREMTVEEKELVDAEAQGEKSEAVLGEIKEGQTLSADQAAELQRLLSRQIEIVKKAKKFQTELKKREIEARSAEHLFNKKMHSMKQQVRAKDVGLEKAKANLTNLAERKDKQIEVQTQRVKKLNAQVSKLKASKNDAIIKKLEKEKISVSRQLDKFKKLSEEAMLRLRNAEKNNRTGALEAELRKQKKTFDTVQTRCTKAEKDLKTAIVKFNEMKKMTVQMKSKFDQQLQLLSDKESEIKKLQDDLANAPAVEAAPAAVSEAPATEEEIHLSPVELQNIIDQKDEKIKELMEQIENGPAEDVPVAPKVETAQAEITKLELKQLTTKLTRLEQAREKSIEEVRGAKKKVADAQRDMKKKDMEIKALEAKYKNLERQFATFKQKNGGRKAS